jgi:hypothetical protein
MYLTDSKLGGKFIGQLGARSLNEAILGLLSVEAFVLLVSVMTAGCSPVRDMTEGLLFVNQRGLLMLT